MVERRHAQSREQVVEWIGSCSVPIVIENFASLFPIDCTNRLSSMHVLEDLRSGDVVGFQGLDGTVHELVFSEAVARMKAHGGYINGWEYLAGDCGPHLSGLAKEIDIELQSVSLLPRFGTGGTMLDSVMKWIFLSCGPKAQSEWHTDPIGSVAWMLILAGEKRWFFRSTDGSPTDEVVVGPGDFLIVPSGIEHRVENVGESFNCAVSHNLVVKDSPSERNMWRCLSLSLDVVEAISGDTLVSIESAQIRGRIDNLAVGLLMVVLHFNSNQIGAFVPEKLRKRVREHSLVSSQSLTCLSGARYIPARVEMIPQGPLAPNLPKTFVALKENAPEYLVWQDPKRAKMRQLSVAFEDNIAQSVDWASISTLRTDAVAQDALSFCLQRPVMLGSSPVHILGITHSSDHSAEHVKEAIEALSPAAIAIESCVDRTQARSTVQLPLVRRYNADWAAITDVSEFGGAGPSLSELAKNGLLDGSLEIAQFMIASGSVSGCPELTALFEAERRGMNVDSIDILESIKIVQNASIDACGYSARKQGDLSEGVLRQVVDEEGILGEYFRMMYGEELNVQPSKLYRLIESRKRSPPFADLLLRELHKVYRPKQYWSRIFLRDVYMSLRIRRIAKWTEQAGTGGKPILVVVGGAHAFGIREILNANIDLPTHVALGLSSVMENADTLCHAWRDVLNLNSFSFGVPRPIPNAESAAALIATSVISAQKVSLWVGGQWQVVELPAANGKTWSDRLDALTAFEVGAGVGKVDLIQALLDGLLDPYSVARISAEVSAG